MQLALDDQSLAGYQLIWGPGLYLNWWVLCLDAQSPGFNPGLGWGKQKDEQAFVIIPGYIMTSSPAWATQDHGPKY